MKETNKCPKCGFYGLMNCWEVLRHDGKNCTCPKCEHTFGNLR